MINSSPSLSRWWGEVFKCGNSIWKCHLILLGMYEEAAIYIPFGDRKKKDEEMLNIIVFEWEWRKNQVRRGWHNPQNKSDSYWIIICEEEGRAATLLMCEFIPPSWHFFPLTKSMSCNSTLPFIGSVVLWVLLLIFTIKEGCVDVSKVISLTPSKFYC